MVRLLVHIGQRQPVSVELGPGTYTIGRSENNTIVVDLPGIAPKHVEVRVTENLQTFVKALDDSELQLDGRSKRESFVKPGDIVTTSGIVLMIELVRSAGNERGDSDEHGIVQGRSFTREVVSAYLYPFRGDAAFVIAGVVVALVGAELLGSILGTLIGLLIGVYLISLFREIVTSTIHGEDEMTSDPPMSFNWDELREMVVPIYAMVLFPSLPFILLRFWPDAPDWVRPSLAVFAFVYVPMGLLLLLVTDDFWAAHPLNVFPSIGRAFGGYSLVLVALIPIVGIGYLSSLSDEMVRSLPRWLLIGAGALLGVMEIYLVLVWARILGLYYRRYREDLAWDE